MNYRKIDYLLTKFWILFFILTGIANLLGCIIELSFRYYLWLILDVIGLLIWLDITDEDKEFRRLSKRM